MGRERRITPREIYSGGQYERDYLGQADIRSQEFLREFDRCKQPSEKPGFNYWMNYRDSMELAKKFQPIDKSDPEKKRVDPANPRAPLLRDIKEALIDQMDLSDKEADELKLYTAVDTPLDYLHGTDAFIEYKGIVVSIDITKKMSGTGKKADVIITEELPAPDDPDTEDEYLARVDDIAASVKSAFKLKGKLGRPKIQKLYKEDRPAA